MSYRFNCCLSLAICAAALTGAAPRPAAAQSAPPDFRVTKIRFYPRPGHAGQMTGAKWVGSLTSSTNDFADIAEIKDAPAEGAWTEIAVPAQSVRAYRFLKYQAPNGSQGDIAEIEFWAGSTRLTGTPFGTTGSREASNNPQLAFDGKTDTFFRGVSTFQQYVGVDLGPTAQTASPQFSVAQGQYAGAQQVTLTSATPGAIILYSLDGWQRPYLEANGQPGGGAVRYDGKPIRLGKSAILQSIAVKPGLADSTTAIAAYRIGAATPKAKEFAQFHIGNSLTDTVNGWVEPLAASGGHKVRFYRFTIPGAPTDWLWDHPGSGFGENLYAQAFLARAPLTDLVTQPFAGHGRSIDNEAEYSGRFWDLARKHSPQLQMWLYVQWPGDDFSRDSWAQGKSSLEDQPVTFGAPAKTWQEAAANHARYTEQVREQMNQARAKDIKAGKVKPVLIVPGGLGLARLKTEIEAGRVPGMTDFFKEVFVAPGDIHCTPKGAYLISLVHYACLYRDNPTGKVTSAGTGLTPEQARVFQRIAWETATSYPYSGVKAASPQRGKNAKAPGK